MNAKEARQLTLDKINEKLKSTYIKAHIEKIDALIEERIRSGSFYCDYAFSKKESIDEFHKNTFEPVFNDVESNAIKNYYQNKGYVVDSKDRTQQGIVRSIYTMVIQVSWGRGIKGRT